MKYLANLDLNQNELQNSVLQNLAVAPSNPKKGQKYFNTTINKECTWNGTTWTTGDTMTGDDIVNAINSSSSQIEDNNLSSAAQTAITNSHTHSNKTLLDSYNQTNTNLSSAVSLKHSQNTDTGTNSSSFTLGASGIKLKNSGGTELQVRNNADTDFADLHIKNLTVDGSTTTINSVEVDIGDNEIVLNSDITASTSNSDGGISVKRLMSDNTTRKDAKVSFNNGNGKWETTFGDVASTLITAQIANKLVFAIGDGSSTAITITHNLNTRDLSVTIRESSSPYAKILTDIDFTNLNSITLNFAVAPTSGQYTVTLIG